MSGDPKSFQVATTLSARRIVSVDSSSADSVKYPAGALEIPFGVTLDTVKGINQSIPVAGYGEKVYILANDTLTAGGLVASDSSGRAIPFVNATAGACYVGVNIGGAVAATGVAAYVYIQPGFKSIP